MDNYLLDPEPLEQFIDGLMKQRPLPVSTPEEIKAFREEKVKELDDKIGMAIFTSLTSEQLDNLNQNLNQGSNITPEFFQNFFRDAGLDLQKIIADTMTSFGKQFLGDQNE